jgi:hypothetical protein
MRILRPLLLLVTAGVALAGVDQKLVGTWTAGSTTIRIEAGGRCSAGAEVGKCQTLRGALFYQAPNGTVTTYGWKVAGEELTISGNGMNQVFQRGEQPAPPTTPPPATPPTSGVQPTTGARWSDETWGVTLDLPAGWKAAMRDGILLLGSDTEAGLMVVRFSPKTDRAALTAGYSQGLQESGVNLLPTSPIADFAAGANRGLAGELGGMAQNGSRLTARVVGVPTPFGDAAIFLGVTTPEQYAKLKPRVEALAAGASFQKPKIPPANVTVAGQYYYIFTSTSGGSYSREDSLSLCANGMFRRKGEMSGSGAAGSAATANAYAGSWSADGDGQAGTVTLQYRNGSSERLRYQKAGVDIVLNGKKYGRFGDGSCAK